MARVVIAGGGLGALRTAESLRANGFTGPITVIGDEGSLPYNRPPLSKEALLDGVHPDSLEFRRKPSVDDVDWRTGSAITHSDLAARTITLSDGETVAFDGLVIATGIRPRRLSIPGPHRGRFVLRTVTDAVALREHIAPDVNTVILGAGFIGCEVAATARTMGANVTIVAADSEPMLRPLGSQMGTAMRRRHEAHGVHFHLGRVIDAFKGDDCVRGVMLDDGTEFPADLVLEAVGSIPNVEWLDGNGLDLGDGILVDSAMQVDFPSAPIVAVGDIARHPNALFGDVPRRIEHWNMPTETGRRAGQTLAALLCDDDVDRGPFTAMPAFWSDQYGYRLQSFGLPGIATSHRTVDGDPSGPCIVEYHDGDGLVGVLGIDRTQDLLPYRKAIMDRENRARTTASEIG